MSDEKKPHGGRTAAEQRAQYLEALEAEKRGYEQSGKKDRAKQVDEQIKALTGDATPKPAQTQRSDGGDQPPAPARPKRGRTAKRA